MTVLVVSPGYTAAGETGSKSTSQETQAPALMQSLMLWWAHPLLYALGGIHPMSAGVARYFDGLMGKNAGAEWKSGTFIASTHFALATGPVADQADNFPMFADIALQNTVAATIRTLLAEADSTGMAKKAEGKGEL